MFRLMTSRTWVSGCRGSCGPCAVWVYAATASCASGRVAGPCGGGKTGTGLVSSMLVLCICTVRVRCRRRTGPTWASWSALPRNIWPPGPNTKNMPPP